MQTNLSWFRYLCGIVVCFLLIVIVSAVAATAAAVSNSDSRLVHTTLAELEALVVSESKAPVNLGKLEKQTTETKISAAEKVVYLTFDDGPDPVNTPRILDILKGKAVHATFFVIGTQVEAYPHILQRIYAEGHAIGNHSYNHRYNELYQSPQAYISQLQKNDAIIEQAIGIKPLVSRAPGGTVGHFNDEYWAALKQRDYHDVGWNISSGDASSARAAQITNNVISQAKKQYLWSHAIVLMHDGSGHLETVAALPQVIDFFKQEGFEFRVVDRSTPSAW
jgi:peptidoglycan-N-acetylglucosamine deacetylase